MSQSKHLPQDASCTHTCYPNGGMDACWGRVLSWRRDGNGVWQRDRLSDPLSLVTFCVIQSACLLLASSDLWLLSSPPEESVKEDWSQLCSRLPGDD